MQKEIWKKIEGCTTYEVSTLGNIKSLPKSNYNGVKNYITKEIILKQIHDKDGYRKVGLKTDSTKKQKQFSVHRLVALHFISNPENKPEINHINGIKDDNRTDNLEWATRKENQVHAYKNKLQIAVRGEQSVQAKLTEKQVLEIRASDLSRKELSLKFNVRQSCICKIIKRQRWTHI